MIKKKPPYVKGKPLRISVKVQQQYVGKIVNLVERMTKETRDKVEHLFAQDYAQEHFAQDGADPVGTMDASTASQARILINALKRRWDGLFGDLALGLSPWMADAVNQSSANATKSAVNDMPNLRDEGRKLSINVRKLDRRTKQILKTASSASADFIKSIPEQHLNKVATAVYNSITNGNGMQDLRPFFDKQESSVKNWAHNTAMDQTRKTFNGLNLGRMKNIGITKGEWLHSGGSNHPRELHEDFDGQLFDLAIGAPVGDDGGNNVSPGEEPNCRCSFAPVVLYDQDLEPDEG